MNLKHCLISFLLLISGFSLGQNQKNELAFAEAYSSIRYFFPTNLSDGDWRLFNYSHTNLWNDSNDIEDFRGVFQSLSDLIEFSKDKQFHEKEISITNPVYWQHYGFGKKNGVNYKSCLVPVDSISYLYNGLQYFERIQGKYDSIEVQLKINKGKELNFSNNFLIYGWKTGRQIISIEDLHYDTDKELHYTRINKPIEDVYFRYFLEAAYEINLEMTEISILGYVGNNQNLIFRQNFLNPLADQLEIGKHHSVDVKMNRPGVLEMKSKEKNSFHQVYEEQVENKTHYFTTKLSNGIYMRFPLILEEEQLIDTILYVPAEFSKENFPELVKSNLIDAYGHLLHFHPYFDASKADFKELFYLLYQNADTCTSLISARDLIRSLLFPVKDAHMYVYNGAIKTPKLFVGISVEFLGKKCFVKSSNVEQIQSGDQVISFQGLSPWEIYQKNKKEFLGGDGYVDRMAKKYVFIEDTSKQFEVVYKRNNKIRKHSGYAKYYSDYIPATEPKIKPLDNGVYYVNLTKLEADTLVHFIKNKTIKGLILDGREGIKVESKILSLLAQDTLFYPKVYVPKYKEPFKKSMEFDTLNQNSFIVGSSKTQIPIILMISSKNYSHEETFIHLANQIQGLQIAGSHSAGCNGMVTEYRGIGGFEVRFTGSVVEKTDLLPLYNIGFSPEITVNNKRKDFKRNRDKLLIKCINKMKE